MRDDRVAYAGFSSRLATYAAIACVPVVALAAAVALPAYQEYSIRAQVSEGLALAAGYRAAVEAAWRESRGQFADLSSADVGAGLPRSGRYVESIAVVSGMIVIEYGGYAHPELAGSVLTLVPALDAADRFDWACGSGQPPAGFETVFEGHTAYTNIDQRFIPSACRPIEP